MFLPVSTLLPKSVIPFRPLPKRHLRNLDDVVYFKVYLQGDFPAGFKRLRNETMEMLDEFRAYSDNIQYEFINPSSGSDKKERNSVYQLLIQRGLIQPIFRLKPRTGRTARSFFRVRWLPIKPAKYLCNSSTIKSEKRLKLF